MTPEYHACIKAPYLHRYPGRMIFTRPHGAEQNLPSAWCHMISARKIADPDGRERVQAQIVWDGVQTTAMFLPAGDVSMELTAEEWTQTTHYAEGGYRWSSFAPPGDWTLDQQAALW